MVRKTKYYIIVRPTDTGSYVDENGQRVDLRKIPTTNVVHTLHRVFKARSIKDFLNRNEAFQKYKPKS